MPTPVDLVTDLPADFEVFGQAVDSSMADLLGGTTGQVLAKNSNTNMDFVWTGAWTTYTDISTRHIAAFDSGCAC
jgi:beta-glucanase (GH16 family)